MPIEKVDSIRSELGELPAEIRSRLQEQYGIKAYDADVIVNQGRHLIDYFERVAAKSGDGKRSSSWIQQDVLRTIKEQQIEIADFPIHSDTLGDLIGRVTAGALDNSRARDVFNYLLANDVPIDQAIRALGIEAVDHDEIDSLCKDLLEANPNIVDDYRNGKKQAIGSLIGQAKKKNPNANPKLVRETLLRLIEES